MDALEELKKRKAEEEAAQAAATQKKLEEKEIDAVQIRQAIVSEIEKYNNSNDNSFHHSSVYNAIADDEKGIYAPSNATSSEREEYEALKQECNDALNEWLSVPNGNHQLWEKKNREHENLKRERDAAYKKLQHPSMSMLIKTGNFNEKTWLTVVELGHLPEYYKKWGKTLVDDPDLANQLIQAVINANDRSSKNRQKKREVDSNRIKKTAAAISIPVTILFFVLIFLTGSISVLWGSIICAAIIMTGSAIAVVISSGIEGNFERLIGAPVIGGIGGLIVFGITRLFSSSQTSSIVSWIILMLIIDAIAIFVSDD